MRIYRTCLEAINDIGREFKKCSSEVWTQTMQNKDISGDESYKTKEIQAFSFAILDTSDKDKMPQVTKDWAEAEFAERISGKDINPGEAYLLRENVWREFLNGDDRFDYTYSERIGTQHQKAIHELLTRPETRQAIIQIHNREIDDKVMGKKRIPCSMFYQLMLRNGKLDLIYVMRSSDFATHFQNDIYLAIKMQEYVAKFTDYEPGKFIMFVSSLHCYKRDWELLKNY